MSYTPIQPTDSHLATLLRVAKYLSRPQHVVTEADACMAFRHTLEMVHEASVVLTTHGEPVAALVSCAVLDAMREALRRLLVETMHTSFTQLQAHVASAPPAEPTSEAELEALVDDIVRRARHQPSPTVSRHAECP